MGGEPLTVGRRHWSLMASESSNEVTVALPSALEEWLDAKAADLGVEREAVVVQLLSSYRAAAQLEDGEFAALFDDDVESEIRDVIADRLPDIVEAVSEEVDTAEDIEAVENRLASDVDRVEREFDAKIQDVRERVIQVRKEADAKAPAKHAHPEIEELSAELAGFEDRLASVESRLDDTQQEADGVAERVAELEAATDRLDELEERLQTVAWVVSDLKEELDAGTNSRRAAEQLKQAAAEADVDRAVCDSCEQPVDIALLSEARCPHCEVAVNDVALPGGLFGKPRLTAVKQLEAGDDGDSDVPDAARRD